MWMLVTVVATKFQYLIVAAVQKSESDHNRFFGIFFPSLSNLGDESFVVSMVAYVPNYMPA